MMMTICEEVNFVIETSDKYVDRQICECKKTFREKLGREPTEKEIEEWLLS